LSYSLPAGSSSSKRVAVWRRLRQLGAQSPAGSLSLLPPTDENVEALHWLAEEIESAGGEAIVLSVERLEGAAEGRLIHAFREARNEEYRQLAAECAELAEPAEASPVSAVAFRSRLEELRRRFGEIARLDAFQAPGRAAAAAALARLEAALRGDRVAAPDVPRLDPADYRGRRWVTRPRPHVDRLASIWLIRRFVDPQARVRYGDTPRRGEVPFDMPEVQFGHHGGRCTFETLIAAFGLGGDSGDPALGLLAEIVHEIDLGDGTSARPEIAGLDGILRGWLAAGWTDAAIESAGVPLFEGLYGSLAATGQAVGPASKADGASPGAKAGSTKRPRRSSPLT
jgi:hypothetical protein